MTDIHRQIRSEHNLRLLVFDRPNLSDKERKQIVQFCLCNQHPSQKKYLVDKKTTNLLVTEIYLEQIKEGYRVVDLGSTNTIDTSLNAIISI